MLRFLRKYSRSTGVKILYGVLAALFVVWGVGAIGGEQVDVVARVHGERISRRELDRATLAPPPPPAARRRPAGPPGGCPLRPRAPRGLPRVAARPRGVRGPDPHGPPRPAPPGARHRRGGGERRRGRGA